MWCVRFYTETNLSHTLAYLQDACVYTSSMVTTNDAAPAACTSSQGECPHCEDPEMFGPCESELTKRAREVLAGLSPRMRESMTFMRSGPGAWCGPERTIDALSRRGLCSLRRHLTYLGREVARLIAEGSR